MVGWGSLFPLGLDTVGRMMDERAMRAMKNGIMKTGQLLFRCDFGQVTPFISLVVQSLPPSPQIPKMLHAH